MRIFTVDAFTDAAFRGNPAGVCLLDRPVGDDWMASVAAEMNLSETAFLLGDGPAYSLRWFTPTVEVELCGHATLASAHVLYELGGTGDELRFSTLSGELRARRGGSGLLLEFPLREPEAAEPPDGLSALLPTPIAYYGRFETNGLAVLADEAAVRNFRPDPATILALPLRVLYVTAQADEGKPYDFVSRCFGPAVGIPEDPVTGSAHCMLGPYWGGVLGKTELVGYQASSRGGTVGVRLKGAVVELEGQAVTVLRGELLAVPGVQ